jgi:hypothetical protein
LEVSRFPEGWRPDGLYTPAPRAEVTSVLDMPALTLGIRHRGADDSLGDRDLVGNSGHELRLRKKAKTTITAAVGVSETRGYADNTHHKGVTRTPQDINRKSKDVNHSAERHVVPSGLGVPNRFLQGPNDLEFMGTISQGQLLSVEGSVQGVEDSSVFCIPKRLDKRHRGLLVATSAELARGVIPAIKCQLCPDADFSNWEDFKRHCDYMEAHPLNISFCDSCGDFFARPDSLRRHCRNRPPECLVVSQEEAAVKRRETERVHEEFKSKLEHHLKTDKQIWKPFAQVIKEMFPKSSKRGSRQQSRLRAARTRP